MASTKQIKTKIKSVQNLQKILKALEIVSTIKLQKFKVKTHSFKTFMQHFLSILQTIHTSVNLFDLDTHHRDAKGKRLILVVTSEKGLCGAINAKLLKHLNEKYGDIKDNVDLFVIGKKGLDFFVKTGWNIVGTCHLKDNFVESDLQSAYAYVKQAVQTGSYAKIKVYFNYFKNTVVQQPLRFKLYPLDQESFDRFLEQIDLSLDSIPPLPNNDLLIEPNLSDYKRALRQSLIEHIIYYAAMNNKTSEQAARMIAMKNAKDNSADIVGSLSMIYNKTRQGKITQEISEIVSAKIAIEN